MNKRYFLVFPTLILYVAAHFAFGAEEIVHAVAFPSGDAAWSVELQKNKKEKKEEDKKGAAQEEKPNDEEVFPASVTKKIEIVRKNGLRLDIVTQGDNSTNKYWWAKDLVLWKKGSDPVRVMRRGYFNDRRYDENFFGWVGKETFKGLESFEARKCRHYRKEETDSIGERIVYDIWIDNETQKPVGWSNGGVPMVFTFDRPLPAEPLVLPDGFSEALTQAEVALNPPKRLKRDR